MENNEENRKSSDKLLKAILSDIKADMECNQEQELRKEMLDDLKFCTLDQWPAELRAAREDKNQPGGARPCLTSDLSNQYITQVVNDMRQNKPAIKIRPDDDDADIDTAKVFQGLIRHIEDKSGATIAYEMAGESAVKMGRGYFRVTTEYVDDSFDQEPRIVPIADALSVYLGSHIMPDGSDAKRGTIIEKIPLEDFKRKYPKAKHAATDFDGSDSHRWRDEQTVTIAEHFYTECEETELFFLANGKSVYKNDYDGAEENIKKKRPAAKETIKWVKLTGAEILDQRDWLGKYIPIVEVVGKQSVVEGKQIVWGLVRPIKDILRMYNYWISAITEKIGLSPKAPFIVTEGQIEGHEKEWAGANKESRPYLTYKREDVNGNATPPPQRVAPAAMEAAMISMMGMIENNVRSALGMYKASVGDASSQQSGRALGLLQRESDTGTFHFADNLSYSIAHLGRIFIDLVPKIIDTKRALRILGEDGDSDRAVIDPKQTVSKREIQTINGIKTIYNLGIGNFDVSVTVGPSYNTKRMEAATIFTELARSATDAGAASVLNYLAIKNSDVTSSDEAVTMLKALLPPQALQAEEQGPIPPQVAAQMQQMQQQLQVMQEKGQELLQENEQLKSGVMEAQMKVQAGVQESQLKIQAKQQETQAELQLKTEVQAAELELERERAMATIQLNRDIAAANLELERMKLDASTDSEINQAIATVKNMVAMHETNMGAMINGKGSDNVSCETDSNSMMNMHAEFMSSIQQIVETLNQKKTINLIKRDGQTVGAEVTVQ